MISNAPGTVTDITNETYRALAFSIWSIGPMNGPVTGVRYTSLCPCSELAIFIGLEAASTPGSLLAPSKEYGANSF